MIAQVALRRLRSQWRLSAVLMIGLLLVTGFFSLGPLYVQALSEVGLRFELDNLPPRSRLLSVIAGEPISPEAWDVLGEELDGLIAEQTRIAQATRIFCGYMYSYGRLPNRAWFPASGPNDHCYQVYALSRMGEYLRLVEGRWPVRLPPPGERSATGLSTDELMARNLGPYSLGDVEGVMVASVAEEAGFEVGTRVRVGEEPSHTVVIHIVGLVEPIDTADPIWQGRRMALSGQITPLGMFSERLDVGIFVPEGAFDDWLRDAVPGTVYTWLIELDPSVVHADNLTLIRAGFDRAEATLAGLHPSLQFVNPLDGILRRFADEAESASGPVTLLSGAVLLLMLYHLVATAALVLERQAPEWATMSCRGGSVLQLTAVQALTATALAILGFVAGPFLAQLTMWALQRIGPLAIVMEGTALRLPPIPPRSWLMSGVAAIISAVALTLPAIPAARRSILELKRSISRPPRKPAWARYYLDAWLLVAGIGFMARMYYFVEPDTGLLLRLLATEPGTLLRMLGEAPEGLGLNDPLNLIGPALLLTGAALLWLRLFPLGMGAVSRGGERDNGLAAPLALWNVARDPGHYAQLVLLLIGTLALGTASLALQTTRDAGAWSVARQSVGADLRVELEPELAAWDEDWTALPDVEQAAPFYRQQVEATGLRRDVTLLGVDLDLLGDFPELRETLQGLDAWGGAIPVVISERFAEQQGRVEHPARRQPLEADERFGFGMIFEGRRIEMHCRVAGIVDRFPSFEDDDEFMIMPVGEMLSQLERGSESRLPDAPNEVWLEVPGRRPTERLMAELERRPDVTGWESAWTVYGRYLREPLPGSVVGMLFAGFWVSLGLSLLDFGFTLAVTLQQRALSYSVLRALGWPAGAIWRSLVAEHAVLVTPALAVGIALGAALAYLLLPFLALIGGQSLLIPISAVVEMAATLALGFGLLLIGAAWWLRGMQVSNTLRLGEE